MSLTTPAHLASESDVEAFLQGAEQAPFLAVDTEATIGGDIRDGRDYAMGLSLAYRIGSEVFSNYFPFRHVQSTLDERSNLDRPTLFRVKAVIENHPCIIFHHAKYDIPSLATLGIEVPGKFYDTMIMAHMINENEPFGGKGLDTLAKYYLNDSGKLRSPEHEAAKKIMGWNNMPILLMHEYAAYDTHLTLRLFEYLWLEWEAQELDKLWPVEMAFIRLLVKMEGRGVRINQALVQAELARGQERLRTISENLGLNPSSPKDLAELLITRLGLPVVKETPGGKPSFDKEAMTQYEAFLAAMDDESASLVLEYRGYQKTVSSNYKPYLELLSPDGRLRPNYKMHGTVTGRLSCEKPNLQQIPRVSDKPWNGALKQAFIAEPGFTLWEADYSQLELRLGAAYAKESELIEIFNSGRDIFTEMARELGMARHDTKTLVYTLQYGGGATRLKNVFGVTLNRAQEIKDDYFERYSGFKRVSDQASSACRRQGYLRYWSGRRRHFIDPQNEAHKAFNSVIQGGAAEIVKHSMLRLSDTVDSDDCRMLLQVHDSVVFEIRNGMEDIYVPKIKEVMEAVEPDFGVHFAVDVHKWGEG